jgi:hypothetical protein
MTEETNKARTTKQIVWLFGGVFVLVFGLGFHAGQQTTAGRHCKAQGYEEFTVSADGRITCVQVTKTPQP